jgi:hypothetical protein
MFLACVFPVSKTLQSGNNTTHENRSGLGISGAPAWQFAGGI